mmetsp:Transcript_22307/g.38285  ORF Transcript_22307/g.38285 Transcript_22307/m.38285 type:complete len:202 (-) Transcript_22307:569-1174(-)
MSVDVKTIGKEIKSLRKHKSSSEIEGSSSKREIEPPRFHRDMRLICDVFRISEQSRYALRNFDAATLDDFSLMTDEDYADLIVTQARIGAPLPPLQQRKLRVLLSWAQSLPKIDKVETDVSSPNKAEGFELKESKRECNGNILKASYKASPRKEGGAFIPSDWENRFYTDLPRLRKELRQMGGTTSNWASEFLSFRWIFCG